MAVPARVSLGSLGFKDQPDQLGTRCGHNFNRKLTNWKLDYSNKIIHCVDFFILLSGSFEDMGIFYVFYLSIYYGSI